MPNDRDTPAEIAARIHGRRLDATCPACAGAVTDDSNAAWYALPLAMRRALELFGAEAYDAGGVDALAGRDMPAPSVPDDVDFAVGFGPRGRALIVALRAALASARPADDGLTAAYLYGVEHGRDARARPDSQPTPNSSQVRSSASARTPGAEACSTCGAPDFLFCACGALEAVRRHIAERTDGDCDGDNAQWDGGYKAACSQILAILDARALAAPAPAPAPVGELSAAVHEYDYFRRECPDEATRDAAWGAVLRAAGAPARGAEGAGCVDADGHMFAEHESRYDLRCVRCGIGATDPRLRGAS